MQIAINDKESLLQRLNGQKDELKSFGVQKLGVFGSFANNKNINKESDVDFYVEFDQEKKSFDNFMNLSFFLEDLLGRKVELITPQSLSKFIGPHILKQVENVIY